MLYVESFPAPAATVTPPYEMTRMESSTTSLIHPAPEMANDLPSSVPRPSARSRKANMPSPRNQPAQFIHHTDIEETNPDENGFIELPPQYSANRRPLLAPDGSPGNEVPPSI